AERLPADSARPHDLYERPKHLAVVDDSREDFAEQSLIANREQRTEQSGHVLHETPLAAVDSRQRDEFGIHAVRKLQQRSQLVRRTGIKCRVQTTCRGVLGQLGLRAEPVSRRVFLVDRIRRRSQPTPERMKQILVGHFPPPLLFLSTASWCKALVV